MEEEKKVYNNKSEYIILKNKEDIDYLAYLKHEADPVIREARQTSKELIERMNERFNKKFDIVTKRDAKKAKKYKKSLRHLEIKDINYKRLYKFLAVFFAVLIVGATISWIILAGKKIKVADYFVAQSFVTTTNGDSTTSELKDMDMAKLTNKKFKDENYPLENNCKLMFKEKEGSLTITTIEFDVKVKGEGALTLKLEYHDSEDHAEDETKVETLSNNGLSVIDGEKTLNYSVSINNKFSLLDNNSYILISIVNEQTEGITAVKFFNLKMSKV